MSFLEHLEATIDLKNNLLTTGQGDTASLRRLSTAHRAVSLTNFSPSGWNLPVSLRRHPGIDPFVLQEEVPPTFHFAQYAADRVTVWLLHGKDLHYLQTLPGPRDNLVFPSDCQDLQDATSLEPERVTYARLSDGHKMIIRDQWRSPAAHPLAGSWTGAVVFASTSATLADSILLGERCIATEPLSAQTAFPLFLRWPRAHPRHLNLAIKGRGQNSPVWSVEKEELSIVQYMMQYMILLEHV